MSFGNANIQEHVVQFAYIIEQIKLKTCCYWASI